MAIIDPPKWNELQRKAPIAVIVRAQDNFRMNLCQW
jgi:hypothetical protein